MPAVLDKPLATIEALWAKRHIHLAAEPEGDRFGSLRPDQAAEGAKTMLVLAVGDSMVAGCGVDRQADGFVPDLALGISRLTNRPVDWHAYGRLGATMKRVRYRLLPEARQALEASGPAEAKESADLLILCAGSNDIMAQRGLDEWRGDLTASIQQALDLAASVIVLSPGQMQNEPKLGPALKRLIEQAMNQQAAVSKEVCAHLGVPYLDLTHEYVGADQPDFYASDHFHPSKAGYQRMADAVLAQLSQDRSWLAQEH
ncbi:lipase [Bifidobacterium aemilianum]|uniref:Lipase n=1 Tax=Bifidobacterium aemilianum TaxID=2493120 RepID=A0A366K9G5_9BIFI|nr:SGNH/GDSL hydrolase family protein [Bifidobacterium aemilianum]RBP98366.1 lipase [Bifidobacterium aemilianum]